MPKTTTVRKTAIRKPFIPVPPSYETAPMMPTNRKRNVWRWILIALAGVLLVLLGVNRGWIIAAIVDGRPIFSWQLHASLRARYGEQTLEGMIGEALIDREARTSGVTISQADIDQKQKEILSSLGTEVSLEDFLSFQGMTKDNFDHQLRVQLTVERLLSKDLTITENDIDNFIATNRATLAATEPGKLREEARQAIIGNAVSEKLQTWFTQLRQKANIIKFL